MRRLNSTNVVQKLDILQNSLVLVWLTVNLLIYMCVPLQCSVSLNSHAVLQVELL